MNKIEQLDAAALGLDALVAGDLVKARALLVLLHGYGANAADLMGLAPELQAGRDELALVSLEAPQAVPGYPAGRQWFPISDMKPALLDAGVQTARPQVEQALARLWQLSGKTPKQTALLGFSQGGMVALEVGLRLTEPLGQLICMSGALAGCERLPDEKAMQTPPILLVHGQADTVVPFTAMESSARVFQALGLDIETLPLPGLGHGIDATGIERVGKALDTLLA